MVNYLYGEFINIAKFCQALGSKMDVMQEPYYLSPWRVPEGSAQVI